MKSKLRLVKVSRKYLPNIMKVIDEYRNDHSPFGRRGNITSLLTAIDNCTLSEWFIKKRNEDKGINLKPEHVRGSDYWLMDGDEYVGSFSLRHDLTDKLLIHGGNIAYIILPSKRRKGYAFSGLSLCLIEAKKIGLRRVLITCDTKNDASYGVMKKALIYYGGETLPDIASDDTFNHRVWVNTIDKNNFPNK